MRVTASLLALSLALPAVAADRGDVERPSPRAAPGRPGPTDAPRAERGPADADAGRVMVAQYTPRPAPAPYATRPAPAPYPSRPAPTPYAPAPRGRRGYRTYAAPGAVAVGTLPFWGGYGFGWGYYPLFPSYPAYAAPYPADGGYPGDAPPPGYGPQGYGPPGYGYPPGQPDRVLVRLGAAAAGMSDGAVGGFSLALDSRTVGFDANVDALVIDDVTRVGDHGGDALGWGSAHLTWSVLADAAFRIRLELGGSMLSFPSTGQFAGLKRAGDAAFGPDVGLSGQLGLVGPIGLEGHVRVTPIPYTVVDSRLALALRGGPLAVTVGWRGIRLYEEVGEVPNVDFSGPELGLSLVF